MQASTTTYVRAAIVVVAVFLLMSFSGGTMAGDTIIIRAGKIVDGTGKVLSGKEISVRDGRIVAIGDHLADRTPPARVIDLDTKTVVPGLIDAHVHITYALAGPPAGDAWAELAATPADARLAGAEINARRTLETGVTTVRDLFSDEGLGYRLRQRIESGEAVGPRLFLSGIGLHPETLDRIESDAQADRVAIFDTFTRDRAREGADWIKIFATAGSASDLDDAQYFFYPEIRAAVEAAHAAGLRVAVHSYGPTAVPDALRAGVDSIEHPVGLDDELLKMWAQTDTIYVPTIDHNRYYADRREEYGYDSGVERELRAFVRRNVEAVRRARKAGIRIAMGSDAVMSMFGQNTLELERFVAAGMTPAEALQTATVNGAVLLGAEGRLGRIAPGFAADIVAVEGDPLSDIRALTRHVVWVMKAGAVVVDRTGSANPRPLP